MFICNFSIFCNVSESPFDFEITRDDCMWRNSHKRKKLEYLHVQRVVDVNKAAHYERQHLDLNCLLIL